MKKEKAVGVIGCVFALVIMLISGCATTSNIGYGPGYQIFVDAIASPDAAAKGKSYYISSGTKDINEDDLQFKEFVRFVENALSLTQKGYERVDSEQKADLLIRLSYGIGNPQTTTNVSTTSYGYGYQVGWMWYYAPPSIETVNMTTSIKNLIVEAYDLKSPKQSQLWKVSLHSKDGQVDSLRDMIPLMAVAAMPYFGEDTAGKQTSVIISFNNPRLADIKKK